MVKQNAYKLRCTATWKYQLWRKKG